MTRENRPSFLLRPSNYFLIGFAVVLTSHLRWAENQWDLMVYYHAGERLWHGENPYEPDIPPGFENLSFLTVYVYPPIFVRVLSPFCLLPQEVIRLSWLVLQALAFEGLYFAGLRLFGREFHPLSWALFHFVGVHHDPIMADFRAGNTAAFEALALTCWAMWRLDLPRRAGAIVGTLIAIKPLLVFVLIWDLVRQKWKPLLWAVGFLGVVGLLMVCDFGLFKNYLDFLHSKTLQELNEEHTAGIYNYATVSVMYRLFTSETVFGPVWDAPLLAKTLTFLIPVVVWVTVFAGWRRLEGWADRIEANSLGFTLLMPSVLLTIPRVGDYNLAVLLVPLFFAGWRAWERRNHVALNLFVLSGFVNNLPIYGGNLDSFSLEMHWLQYRYVALVLFWLAALCMTFDRPTLKSISKSQDSTRG